MKVITATRKEFSTDYIVPHLPSSSLYIRILDSNSDIVRKVFGDPAETNLIECEGQKFVGYTRLDTVKDEGNALKVRLIHA